MILYGISFREVWNAVLSMYSAHRSQGSLARPITSEATKVHDDDLVRHFRLSIGLGVKGRRMCNLAPKRCISSFQKTEVKTGSLSKTMNRDTPWRRTISAKKTCATDSAVYG